MLDSPNPYFNENSLLKPTKYVSKIKTLIERSKEKVINLFNKTKKGATKSINWINYLKNNVLDIFNKLQKKAVMNELKFKLDKEPLNVTKRYTQDLKKAGFYLHGPLSFLIEIKPLVIEKFKEYPGTKQQLTIACLMKKKQIPQLEKKL